MANFDVNVNIHISADNNFVNALSDIAGCMAAISLNKSGVPTPLPEKTVTPPERHAEPVKKVEPKKKATKTEEKPLKGEPVTREKAKEINDLVDMPDKKAEPDKKPEQEKPAKAEPAKPEADEAAKREKMKKLFTKAATDGKAAACKALLKELGVTRQSQIPADKLDEALAKVEAL